MFTARRLGGISPMSWPSIRTCALGRHFEAGEHAQQRGLAAAGRPEQREELAGLDVEADIVHADR